MIWKLYGRPEVNLSDVFTDISHTTLNTQKAIVWAADNKLVNGYGNKVFKPDKRITKSQVMIILWKLSGRNEPLNTGYLSDIDSLTLNNKKAVYWGIENSLIEKDNNLFHPETVCSREVVVDILYKFTKNILKEDISFALPSDSVNLCVTHSYEDKELKPPSLSEDGIILHKCAVCGYEFEEKIPKIKSREVYDEEIVKGGNKIHIIKIFEQDNAHANAILLESDGHFAMVDVGWKYNVPYDDVIDTNNAVVNYLKNYGVEKLDFILLTHLHADHTGNIEEVCSAFHVDIIYTRVPITRKYILRAAEKNNSEQIILKNEQKIKLGNYNITVLNIDDNYEEDEEWDNNNSICLYIADQYGNQGLLTGDLNNYDNDEYRLISKYPELLKDLDFFEVGHHGYMGSSTKDFIEFLNPAIVVNSGYFLSRGVANDTDDGKEKNSTRNNFINTRAYQNNDIYMTYSISDEYFNKYGVGTKENEPCKTVNGIVLNLEKEITVNRTYINPSVTGNANKQVNFILGSGLSSFLYSSFTVNYYDRNIYLMPSFQFISQPKGYTFQNKFKVNNADITLEGTIPYNVSDLINITNTQLNNDNLLDIVVDPVFTPNKYKINFFANGGEGEMEEQWCTYDMPVNLSKNQFKKEGYRFKCWSTSKDIKNIYYGSSYKDEEAIKNLASLNNAQINLYAQWEPIN